MNEKIKTNKLEYDIYQIKKYLRGERKMDKVIKCIECKNYDEGFCKLLNDRLVKLEKRTSEGYIRLYHDLDCPRKNERA